MSRKRDHGSGQCAGARHGSLTRATGSLGAGGAQRFEKPSPIQVNLENGFTPVTAIWGVTPFLYGPAAMSIFSYAGLSTQSIFPGNVAMRAGKKIQWDGPKLRVASLPEGNKLVHAEHRIGWVL